MNEALNNILTRRSTKKFKSLPVEKEKIKAIIEAGLKAPSGLNKQASIIVAVTDKATRDALSRTNGSVRGSEGDLFYNAPVVLIVLANKEVPTYLYDGSLTMGNLMLAAHSLGVSSCWIHRARETFEMPEWRKWLSDMGIPESYEGIGNCVLGYKEDGEDRSVEVREGRTFWVE